MHPLQHLADDLSALGATVYVGPPAWCVPPTAAPEPEPEFVDINEVSRMLGIKPRSVRRRWYDGTIPPPEKFGRNIRWRRLDIENIKGKYNNG